MVCHVPSNDRYHLYHLQSSQRVEKHRVGGERYKATTITMDRWEEKDREEREEEKSLMAFESMMESWVVDLVDEHQDEQEQNRGNRKEKLVSRVKSLVVAGDDMWMNVPSNYGSPTNARRSESKFLATIFQSRNDVVDEMAP